MKTELIYLVHLWPNDNLIRIKVGRTTDILKRLKHHRTTNPQCSVIATWKGGKNDEDNIKKIFAKQLERTITGQPSEVIVGLDTNSVKKRCNEYFLKRA